MEEKNNEKVVIVYKCYPSQVRANEKYRLNNKDKINQQKREKRIKQCEDEEFLERERERSRKYYEKMRLDPEFMEKQRQRGREKYKKKKEMKQLEEQSKLLN